MVIGAGITEMKEIKALLGDTADKAPDVMRRALNKTLRNVQTFTSKQIRKTYTVKAKRIKKAFKNKKANNRDMTAILICSGRKMTLMQFGAKQTARGVSYKIKKTGGRKMIKGGFIAEGKSGNTLVFHRGEKYQGKPVKPGLSYGRLPRPMRQPIFSKYGPSIPTMMEDSLSEIQAEAARRKKINLEAEVAWALRKWGGG